MIKVMVCYDGSPGAQRAVEAAGHLFPGAQTTVAHAWHAPYPFGGLGYGGQVIIPPEFQHELARDMARHGEEVAQQGVELAKRAGLEAHGVVREASGPVWRCLLDIADDADVDSIVAGSRGYGEVRALVLGSISTALSHNSNKPLVIVPAEREG